MQQNFYSKYKDREPLETVQIIKDFFYNRGYTIKEIIKQREESLTWYVGIELYYKDNMVQAANGKGLTKDFALASGHAELYERYCNKIAYANNPFIGNKVLDIHYKNHNYYFDKNEKLLTVDETFQYDRDFCESAGDGNPEMMKYFYSTIFENRFIGVPYRNILNPDKIIYYDPRIISSARSSTGMAAGNDFYEAFNQGLSEVLEHYLTGLYIFDPFDEYYELDLNNIDNQDLQKSIRSIEKNGKKIKVYDLSYNSKMPVLMAVVFTEKYNLITVNLGAFPVFDIALERIITELYQGDDTLTLFRKEGQIPYLSESPIVHVGTSTTNTNSVNAFPESILLKTKKVSEYSSTFLKAKEYSNQEIFSYYQNLCKTLDLDIYYYDNSFSDKMTSISILAPHLPGLICYKLNSLSQKKNQVYTFAIMFYNYLKTFLDSGNYNFQTLKELLKMHEPFNTQDGNLLGQLLHDTWLFLFNLKADYYFLDLIDILSNYGKEYNNRYLYHAPKELKTYICKYVWLYRYISNLNYSKEEILYLANFFNLEYSEEDFENILEPEFFIKKAYLEPLYLNFQNNQEYFEILANY